MRREFFHSWDGEATLEPWSCDQIAGGSSHVEKPQGREYSV